MGAVLITVAFDVVLITAAAHGSAFKMLLFAGPDDRRHRGTARIAAMTKRAGIAQQQSAAGLRLPAEVGSASPPPRSISLGARP